MKRTLIVAFSVLMLLVFASVSFAVNEASADAWWGEGARSKEWVLTHGGTIIKYKIVANGAKDRYKAVLYKNGKAVEWENGKTGVFDDAKNSTYTISALKGGIEKKKTSKGGKKILSSGPIKALAGRTMYVLLNDLTGKVTVTSNLATARKLGF